MIKEENIRIIFGLKLRQLRTQQKMSLASLSKKSGLSASYLNEIERGKKHPKPEKIAALAAVFEVSYDEMVSLQLSKKLAPLKDLLMTNILKDLPLEVFGLDFNKLVDLMANAPSKVGAFFKTIIEIARNYDLQKEYFYFATLRSYQEINNNYFEDIEKIAAQFLEEYDFQTAQTVQADAIANILENRYGYQIELFDIHKFPELKTVRSFFIPNTETPKLMLNPAVTNWQRRYILSREVGYQQLEIKDKDRPQVPLLIQAPSFDWVFNHFRASYFSAAVLMPEKQILGALKTFFARPKWSATAFWEMMKPYGASPELFLLRITNLMPRFFGLKQIFFLRFQNKANQKFELTRELHLEQSKRPHGNEKNQHYCRRWSSIRMLKNMLAKNAADIAPEPMIEAQLSHYIDSDETYFTITMARPMLPNPNAFVSVVIGWVVSAETRKKIAFLADKNIPQIDVNTTCETCLLTDCKERAAPAKLLEQKQKNKRIRAALKALGEEN